MSSHDWQTLWATISKLLNFTMFERCTYAKENISYSLLTIKSVTCIKEYSLTTEETGWLIGYFNSWAEMTNRRPDGYYTFTINRKPLAFQKPDELVRKATEVPNLCKHECNYEWIKQLWLAESYSSINWSNLCFLPDLCCFAGREFLYRNNCV